MARVFIWGLTMRCLFQLVCVGFVCSWFSAWAQPSQPFPIGSPQVCVNLPDHAAVQACQMHQQAQGQEWAQHRQERNASDTPRLSDTEIKPTLNCFKREFTGELVCAN